jgi:hypothetical protein
MTPELSDSTSSETYISWVQQQVQQINDSLGDGQGIQAIVPMPGGADVIATAFGFLNPDLIKINGTDHQGNETCVLMHKSRFQLVIKKVNQGPEINPQLAFQSPGADQAKQVLFDQSA